MEQLLVDAKRLVKNLRDQESVCDSLLRDASTMNMKMEAYKQLRDEVAELNKVANHRPRSTLILGSQEENARIRDLQQENIELQTSLAEYQSALELIMAKYRDQVLSLVKANQIESDCTIALNNYKELQAKAEQICEMTAVMSKAISIDDNAIQAEEERIARLEIENRGLRELLRISGVSDNDSDKNKN